MGVLKVKDRLLTKNPNSRLSAAGAWCYFIIWWLHRSSFTMQLYAQEKPHPLFQTVKPNSQTDHICIFSAFSPFTWHEWGAKRSDLFSVLSRHAQILLHWHFLGWDSLKRSFFWVYMTFRHHSCTNINH